MAPARFFSGQLQCSAQPRRFFGLVRTQMLYTKFERVLAGGMREFIDKAWCRALRSNLW